MGLSTGSRITINGIHGTAIIVNWQGDAKMVKYDKSDFIFEVTNQTIEPVFAK